MFLCIEFNISQRGIFTCIHGYFEPIRKDIVIDSLTLIVSAIFIFNH